MGVLAAFLRGVNMAGHNKIRMTELSLLFRNLGYKNVETYIQSGNVIFNTSDDLQRTVISIEKAVQQRFKFEIPVMIRTSEEMRKIIHNNPFPGEKDFDPAKSAVIFLDKEPDLKYLSKIAGVNYHPDRFKIAGKEIFIYCPNGFGKTKLYTGFFENKMKIMGTARNWKTVTAITEIVLNLK